MGFFVVMLGLGAAWALLVMPVFGLVCLALSLLFRYLHKKHVQNAENAARWGWRRIAFIIFAVLAGGNLLVSAACWIGMLIIGNMG